MDDLISRQATIDEFDGAKVDEENCTEYDIGYNDGIDFAIRKLSVLPSAQPNVSDTNVGDMISRQAAIDALDALCDRECEYSKKQRSVMCGACHLGSAFDVIEQLPSARPEQRWIPCSERLPEEYGEYRITWTTSFVPSKRLVGDAEYEVTSVWDEERGTFKGEWLLDDYIQVYPDVKVIAWMPLPEPYAERRTDEKT